MPELKKYGTCRSYFSGYQKRNFGKTGRENMLSMLDYSQHISKESMYNTPPVFLFMPLC
jgi:phosphoserine aminotransferase